MITIPGTGNKKNREVAFPGYFEQIEMQAYFIVAGTHLAKLAMCAHSAP
jgi:hypothetical protein